MRIWRLESDSIDAVRKLTASYVLPAVVSMRPGIFQKKRGLPKLIDPLTKPESLFIEKRKKLLKLWPIVASILLLGIGFLAAWLFWNTPLLINPYAVIEQLNTRSIPDSTTSLMVVMLPIVMLMCLFLTVVLILFMFVAFSNEKKHMAIIERLLQSR